MDQSVLSDLSELLGESTVFLTLVSRLNGTIIFASAAALTLLGYSSEELIGKNSWELMHPDDVDRVREHTLAVEERGGKVSSNQFRRRHKEGHYVYFSVSSMVKGERFYSQEHSIDNEIRRQSMLDKQGYISTTAHDLRTPLTVFQSSIDILQQSKLTEEQLDVLQQTQAAVDLMHMISSNMMEVGKQDAGEPIKPSVGPVDIKTLLDRCQMLVEGTVPKADTDVNLIIEMDPSLSTPIVTDRCWVWTMMMNYLRNAFRFEVRDTGIGVEHDKLFEPHPSGKRGATGGMRHLGLHSVKMKCERLGGSCGREDNESGVGSIFFFEVPDRKGRGEGENSRPSTTTRGPEPAIKLPTTTSQVEVFAQSRRPGKEAAKEAKEAGEVAEQPRALVIDDTASVRKLLSRMLESKDIKCDEARNGLEGLHMMRAKTYSVVLCDAFMPVMGGMECIRRFRNWEATHRVTRQFVVGISSYLEGFDRETFEVDTFLSKPIDLQWLKELVKIASSMHKKDPFSGPYIMHKPGADPQIST